MLSSPGRDSCFFKVSTKHDAFSVVVMNKCMVKYINPYKPTIEDSSKATIDDFVCCTASVEHSNYEELHTAVERGCPRGFVCEEPIALHHEVLWMINRESSRKQDVLHHAIEVGEYDELWKTNTSTVSVCVDVHPEVDEFANKAISAEISKMNFPFTPCMVNDEGVTVYMCTIEFGGNHYLYNVMFEESTHRLCSYLLFGGVLCCRCEHVDVDDLVKNLCGDLTSAIESHYLNKVLLA